MVIRNISVVGFLFLLMACSPTYRVDKPGGTQEQYAQDRKECIYEASKAVAPVAADNPFIAQSEGGDLARQCLETRGYVFTKTN